MPFTCINSIVKLVCAFKSSHNCSTPSHVNNSKGDVDSSLDVALGISIELVFEFDTTLGMWDVRVVALPAVGLNGL